MTDRRGVTTAEVRRLVLAFPGTEEGLCSGTAGFRVHGITLARFLDEGRVLVVKCGDAERDLRIDADPEAFFISEEFHGHPIVLARLVSVRADELRDVIEVAWLRIASKRLRDSYVAEAQQSRVDR